MIRPNARKIYTRRPSIFRFSVVILVGQTRRHSHAITAEVREENDIFFTLIDIYSQSE